MNQPADLCCYSLSRKLSLNFALSTRAKIDFAMPDLHAITLHKQEGLDRERREEAGAVQASVRLDGNGLLRYRKKTLPSRRQLRHRRIATPKQYYNQPNGLWWFPRLAASPDSHEAQRAKERICKVLLKDIDILHPDWSLSKDNSVLREEPKIARSGTHVTSQYRTKHDDFFKQSRI